MTFIGKAVCSLTCVAAVLAGGKTMAADPTALPTTLPASPPVRLWEGNAPLATGTKDVDVPTLTVFLPVGEQTSTPAMVVCPGGGYRHLAAHEGEPAARWLNSLGIAAGVLKYRLGSDGYHHPAEMYDVQRALRLMRFHAADWKIDPQRVGVIGFSAGGHLAATAATHFELGSSAPGKDGVDRLSCRPDLALLIYPVISMEAGFAHIASKNALLGNSADPALVRLMSNEKQVTAQTPPCFLVHTADDPVVPVANSIAFFQACREKNVPAELHIFEHGNHGFAMGGNDPELSQWPGLAEEFLRRHGFVGNGAK